MYEPIKIFHMSIAFLSIAGFFTRFIISLAKPSVLQNKFLRVAPHLIDTLLLISAVVLMVVSSQYPFVQTWLTVKLFAVIAYIILGAAALKQSKSLITRMAAFIATVLCITYILGSAFSKNALFFAS